MLRHSGVCGIVD